MRPWPLLIPALLACAAAPGEVYRWQTPDGVTHYGERRPGDAGDAVAVPMAPAPAPGAGLSADERALLKDADRRAEREQRARDAAAATAARTEASRARRCAQLAERRHQADADFDRKRTEGYTLKQEHAHQRRVEGLDRELRADGCR